MISRKVFLGGVLILAAGLGAFAIHDAAPMRRDLAMAQLRTLREARRNELRAALTRYQQTLEGDDTQAQATAWAELLAHLRNARLARGDGYDDAIAALANMGDEAARALVSRLDDPSDPYWLMLYDALASGLAFVEGPTGDPWRERLRAWEQKVLSAPWDGPDGPLRARLAIHRHRERHTPEAVRRDLGVPDHDAVPHLIALLESENLFDRLAAAGALENVLCRLVDVDLTAPVAEWRTEAQRWREWWKENRHKARIALLGEVATGEDVPLRLRADACQRLGETGDSSAAILLIDAIRHSSLRLGDTPDPTALTMELVLRARAAGALARLGYATSIRQLLEFLYLDPRLGSGMHLVSMEELESLGKQASPFIMAELHGARARRNPDYRRALEVLLQQNPIDASEARRHFLDLWFDGSAADRLLAVTALTRLDDQSDQALLVYAQALDDDNPHVRIAGAGAQLQFGARGLAIPVLLELLGHEDEVVAQTAHSKLKDAIGYKNRPDTTASDITSDRYAVQRRWQAYWDEHRGQILRDRP